MDEILLILLAIAWALGTPVIALWALIRTGTLREQNERLAAEVAALHRRFAEAPPSAALPPPFAAEPAPTPPPVIEAPVVETPVAEMPPPVEPVLPPPFEEAPVAAEPAQPPALTVAPIQAGWEQRLGARAFIWVGAITLALSAIFLVRYSIEEGYLSPEVRVILAALFGAALVGAAEKVRVRDDRVSQGMAAAGIAALYGALFAAVGLYDMVSKPMAGIAAAVLTSAAIGISLRHGIFVAGLAFVGGFASPALIGSDNPNTPVLFGYLLAIAAGTLAVIRHRGWWPLGWGVLAGSALWTLVWLSLLPYGHVKTGPFELHWVGGFQVAVAGLFVWATWQRLSEAQDNPPIQVVAQVWAALGVTGAALFVLVVEDRGVQNMGWFALALHGLGAYALARLAPRFQYAAALAPALSLATLAVWWVSSPGSPIAWDGERFATRAILFGGLYAGAAFALMWNAGRPGFWAALSVAAALSHFLLTWWIMRGTATGTPWGLISIGLAAPFLVAAERLSHWRDRMPGATEALGFLAAGVSFFIAAAIPLELSREWITVAYAIELAAVAYIAWKLELVAMRHLCWPLLAAVIVRFVLNPEILKYPLGAAPLVNWMLWGYGISIAAFVVGARFLRAVKNDYLVTGVEAGVALLGFTLVTLEVRSLFHGTDMAAPDARFMERAFYVLIWGAFAVAALWYARMRHDVVALWTWRLVGGLAAFVAIFVQTIVFNPVFGGGDVGPLPLFNGLLVAYAAPAVLAGLARRWSEGFEPDKKVGQLASVVASVLVFAWLSLEVRHWFDPKFERDGLEARGVELYTYSIVWLLFGVALLAAGFARKLAVLRHAGMALVCIVVVKVFLIDMAGLQGLLRVLSFLGLGAALMGLGYAYRRYGFDPPPTAKTGS
jgi:uncharacterized membrane protein